MPGPTLPFDVVVALQALVFPSKDAAMAWICGPNADLGGLSVSAAVADGRYDDAIRAITLEAGRQGLRRYHPSLADDGR